MFDWAEQFAIQDIEKDKVQKPVHIQHTTRLLRI
mgnify:CR=1 FL=1